MMTLVQDGTFLQLVDMGQSRKKKNVRMDEETREVRILIPLVPAESNDRPINNMSSPSMERDTGIAGTYTRKMSNNISRSRIH